MIVGDLDIVDTFVLPSENDSPLIVDANAVLAGSISAKDFEPIGWRCGQVAKGDRSIQHKKLPKGYRLNIWRKPA